MLVDGSSGTEFSAAVVKGYKDLKRCEHFRTSHSSALVNCSCILFWLCHCDHCRILIPLMPSILSCVMQKIALVSAHIGRYKLKQPRCQSQAKEMRATSPTAWGAPCSAKDKSSDTAKLLILLARCISGSFWGYSSQAIRGKRNQNCCSRSRRLKSSYTSLGAEQFLHPPGVSWAEQQSCWNNIPFCTGSYARASQSHGQGGAKKGHYSQPDMDEPSLTHALGKHCSLCSVILFHIPLILITFSFSHLFCWLPGKWSNAFSWELPTCITNRFFFQDATEPHFAINNLQIRTIKS